MDYLAQNNAISVTLLNEYINTLIKSDQVLSNVRVRGEISNFKSHPSGHLYFSLKDDGGVLRCVMFKSAAARLKFLPTDGMKLIVRGSIGVYAQTGQYQLYVQSMEIDGIGDLYRAFEQLKKRLESEGLFREERKKSIPAFPKKIGIITSESGAAVRDILNILGRRYPLVEVLLFPALVQGVDAPATLIRGVQYFRKHRPDLIIIGRGGGSMEDLWCFNDEMLAREIADCEVPVISAVGHEVDFTICDFVADLRAPTPSAAAELAVPDVSDLAKRISSLYHHATVAMDGMFKNATRRLNAAIENPVLVQPMRMLTPYIMRLTQAEERLSNSAQQVLITRRHALALLAEKMHALSPLAVLSRGYAITTNASGKCVRSISNTEVGEEIQVSLSDGLLKAKVLEKISEESK